MFCFKITTPCEEKNLHLLFKWIDQLLTKIGNLPVCWCTHAACAFTSEYAHPNNDDAAPCWRTRAACA